MKVTRGVTRTVILTHKWAIKLPSLSYQWGIRGWIANQSEWAQRDRKDVCYPLLNLGNVVLVFLRARPAGLSEGVLKMMGYTGDEAKPSSWGKLDCVSGRCRHVLIDYDNSEKDPRSRVGEWYWGKQEKLARKWSSL